VESAELENVLSSRICAGLVSKITGFLGLPSSVSGRRTDENDLKLLAKSLDFRHS